MANTKTTKAKLAAMINEAVVENPQPSSPPSNTSNGPVRGDLVIGHNTHVVHPDHADEAFTGTRLYIGAITKSPHGFKGQLYVAPQTAEAIRQGAAKTRGDQNAVIRKSRHKVRFALTHMWMSENGRLEAPTQKLS